MSDFERKVGEDQDVAYGTNCQYSVMTFLRFVFFNWDGEDTYIGYHYIPHNHPILLLCRTTQN